jgi:hypothetical protein
MHHRQNVALEWAVPFADAAKTPLPDWRAQTDLDYDEREHMPSRPSFADDRL